MNYDRRLKKLMCRRGGGGGGVSQIFQCLFWEFGGS